MVVLIELLFVLTPLVCWVVTARTLVVGVVVGLLLAACAAGVVAVQQGWLVTRASAETYVCQVPVAVVLVLGGALVERRLRGPRPKGVFTDRITGARIAFGAYAALFGLLAVPLYLSFVTTDAAIPSDAVVRPLPPGLTVLSEDRGCDSGTCSRYVEVGSPAGLSAEQIEDRLRAGLKQGNGWVLTSGAADCRRNGWLLDRRRLCVSLVPQGRSVYLKLQLGGH